MMKRNSYTFEFTDAELEGLQNDLSDFLCWIGGYNAGCRAGDTDGYPFDVHMIQSLNIKIKSQLPRTNQTKERG